MSTNLPLFRLGVNNRKSKTIDEAIRSQQIDITRLMRDRIIQLSVTDGSEDDADKLELLLDNRNFDLVPPNKQTPLTLLLPRRRVVSGKIRTKWYYWGTYNVVEIERSGPPHQMKISCLPAEITKALKTKRVHNYSGQRLNDIAQDIAQRNGLYAVVDPNIAGQRIEIYNDTMSDWHLLRLLASTTSGRVKISNGAIYIMRRYSMRKASDKQFFQQVRIPADDVLRYRHVEKVKQSYDLMQVKVRNLSDLSKDNTYYIDINGNHYVVATSPNVTSYRRSFASLDEAKRVAVAKLLKYKANVNQLELDVIGQALLFAERPIKLVGFPDDMSSPRWVTDECRHIIGDKGWQTQVNAVIDPELKLD